MTGTEETGRRAGSLRRLFGDSLVYGLGRFAGYLVALVLMPVYTRYLSVESYGVLENLFVAAALLSALVPLGLPAALQRFWFLAKDARDRAANVGTAYLSVLVLLFLSVPVLLFLAPGACRAWFGDERGVNALRIALVTLLPSSLMVLSFAILKSRFQAWRFGACSVLQVVLLGILNTWFVAGAGLGVTGIFLGGFCAAAATAGLALWFVRGDLTLRFRLPRLGPMLAYGLPLVPSTVAFWALGYSDRYLVTALEGLHVVGQYSAGAKIAGVLLFVNFATTTAFVPLALEAADRPDAKRFYARALTAYACTAAAGAVALSAFAREALGVLAPAGYLAGYRVVPWLATGLVLAGCAPIVNIGLHVVRRTHHITWIALAAAAANILLNLLLIPCFGMVGAAAGTALAYLLMTVLYYLVTRRLYPVRFPLGRLLRLGLLYAAALLGLHLLAGEGAGPLAARAGVVLAFPLLLIALRVLRPGDVRGLWNTLFRHRRGGDGVVPS